MCGREHYDKREGKNRSEMIMNDGAHHGRPADLENLARRRPQRRLPAHHVGAVREHHHAHKREAVVVPRHGRQPVAQRVLAAAAVAVLLDAALRHGHGLVVRRDVDGGDFVVDGRHQVHARDF